MLNKSYLAGLWEGDGHISFTKDKNPRFCITTHQKNEPWLLLVKKELGDYGFIRRKTKEHALVLTVSNKDGLVSILTLLNGHLKTPKIYSFNLLIDWMNANSDHSFEKFDIDYDLNNHWLAGFIDADGCFYIRYSEPKASSGKPPRVATRFTLDQKMFLQNGESYEKIINSIVSFLDCKLYLVTKKNGHSYYNISSNSIHSVGILILYFEKYSLKSSKYLDYLNFKEVSYLLKNKNCKDNLQTIKYLKRQMNNSRKICVWEHLKQQHN